MPCLIMRVHYIVNGFVRWSAVDERYTLHKWRRTGAPAAEPLTAEPSAKPNKLAAKSRNSDTRMTDERRKSLSAPPFVRLAEDVDEER